MQQSGGDACDRRLWRRQGSNKEWQQQGDWQVTLVGTQTEPLLQQELLRAGASAAQTQFLPKAEMQTNLPRVTKAKILSRQWQDFRFVFFIFQS